MSRFDPHFQIQKRIEEAAAEAREAKQNEMNRDETREETIEKREELDEVSGRISRQWRRSKKRIVGDFPCPTSATKSGLQKQQNAHTPRCPNA